MTWRPFTVPEFTSFLAAQDKELEPTATSRLSPFGCAPSTIPSFHAGVLDRDVMWVVARSGNRVLVFDSVEEEFGIGVVDCDGVLKDWGTFGEKLRWAVTHFLAGDSDKSG